MRGGRSYIGHITDDRIGELVRPGKLTPGSDFSKLQGCDAAIICVPTPLDQGRNPDLNLCFGNSKGSRGAPSPRSIGGA